MTVSQVTLVYLGAPIRSSAHCLTSDLTHATARFPIRTDAGKLFSRINK
jgi:hypothetical protein